MPTRPAVHRPPTQPGRQVQQQRYDAARGTRTERLYDNAWLAYSKRRLAEHPWCVRCLPRWVPATVTDHKIPPASQPERYEELFRDPRNHQSLCKTCHDSKTVLEDGGFGRHSIHNERAKV